jgi:cell division protein FtsN
LSGAAPLNSAVLPALPLEQTAVDSGFSLQASELSAVPEEKAAPEASEKKTGEAKPVEAKKADAPADPRLVYLDVGSFKDAGWADSAVEKLTQLGFHAVSVHKAHLWMQSYHVSVGPYSDAKEMEAAENALTAKGFKPHPVK